MNDWDILSMFVPIQDVYDNPDLPWNRTYLSSNRSIDGYIMNVDLPNATGEWVLPMMSFHIPISYVLKYPYAGWNTEMLCHNKGITIDIINRMGSPHCIDWKVLSENVPIRDIYNNIDLPWNRLHLSSNRQINFKVMSIHLPNAKDRFNWKQLSTHIDPYHIANKPYKKYDRSHLSYNRGISIDIINMHLPNATGNWDWDGISMNIPISDVIHYPNLPWSRNGLSSNRDITLDLIDHLYIPNATGNWDWRELTVTLPIEDILNDRMMRRWNFDIIHTNRQFSLKYRDPIVNKMKEYNI